MGSTKETADFYVAMLSKGRLDRAYVVIVFLIVVAVIGFGWAGGRISVPKPAPSAGVTATAAPTSATTP